MSLLDANSDSLRETALNSSALPPKPADPGIFQNFIPGAGNYFMRGMAESGRALSMAGAAVPVLADKIIGSDNRGESFGDRYFRWHDETFGRAVDYWTPKPGEVGAAGQVVGSLAAGLTQFLANPALLIGTAQLSTAEDLVRQGVDAGAANVAGDVAALSTLAGIALPIFGKTLAGKIATGAAGNLATNVPQAAITRAVVQAAGAPDVAAQFDPWDVRARTVDLLMGIAFGAKSHLDARAAAKNQAFLEGGIPSKPTAIADAAAQAFESPLTATQRDAIMVMNAARHMDEAALPWKAGEAEHTAAVDNVRTAIAQISRGQEVDVPPLPPDDFLTVWHGSPHKFDAFDASKIGTGEGAQAYGHGLYLAENPEVASSYSKMHSAIPSGYLDYVERAKEIEAYTSNPPSWNTWTKPKSAIEALQDREKFPDARTAEVATNFLKTGVPPELPEYLYRAAIPRSMIERMLDWDKPLSQQAPEVRATFESLGFPSSTGPGDRIYSGESALKALGLNHRASIRDGWDMKSAADTLQRRGIPGIRYLDGGSRANGEGTYNYVIFPGEEGNLRIHERNGEAVQVAQSIAESAPKSAEPVAAPEMHVGPEPWDVPQTAVRALPEPAAIADDLRSLGRGAGWAQEGGSIVRATPSPSTLSDYELQHIHMMGEVVGRTKWIPFEAWFAQMRSELGKGGLSKPEAIQEAIEKAIEGKPLKAAERRTVDWLRAEVQRMDDSLLTVLDDAPEVGRDARALGLGPADTADIALTARAAELDAQAVERAAIRFEEDDAAFMAEVRRIVGDEEATRIEAAAAADNARAGARPGGSEAPAAQGEAAPGQAVASPPQFAEDLRVPSGEFDPTTGAPKTVSANEYVAKAAADAEHVKATAEGLMRTVATCILGGI